MSVNSAVAAWSAASQTCLLLVAEDREAPARGDKGEACRPELLLLLLLSLSRRLFLLLLSLSRLSLLLLLPLLLRGSLPGLGEYEIRSADAACPA